MSVGPEAEFSQLDVNIFLRLIKSNYKNRIPRVQLIWKVASAGVHLALDAVRAESEK